MSLFFVNLDIDTIKRFDMAKFMDFKNQAHDPITSSLIFRLKDLPSGGEIVVRGEEARPDLISFRALLDTQYWWIIMLYNDVIDVNDLVEGQKLNVPDQGALDDLFFSLKADQVASEV